MRIDAVQIPDHVDIQRAAPERAPLGLLVASEVLVQNRILKLAKGILLRNQPFGAFNIARA